MDNPAVGFYSGNAAAFGENILSFGELMDLDTEFGRLAPVTPGHRVMARDRSRRVVQRP